MLSDKTLQSIQKCISLRPVIVLGSGYSCQYGLASMNDLAKYLVKEISPKPAHSKIWKSFCRNINTSMNLETALSTVDIPEELEISIINKTKDLILKQDQDVLNKIINKKLEFPLTDLLRHLHDTANPNLKIVSTNYDRLAEYAVDKANLEVNNGFKGRYFQYFNNKYLRNSSTKNEVAILKVHGSIDWYISNDNNIHSLPDSLIYEGLKFIPSMITPGIKKYELTHNEPFRSIIAQMVFFSPEN